MRAELEWLSVRTRVTPTDWVLGIEARVRALLSEGEVAEHLYREAIEQLREARLPSLSPDDRAQAGLPGEDDAARMDRELGAALV